MSGLVRAMSMLIAVLDMFQYEPEWSIAFCHKGAPQSKARARVVMRGARVRAFTPEQTQVAQDALSWQWRLASKGRTLDGNLALAAVFYRPNRQAIDVDNMLKLVLDAGTKAQVWHDDSQLTTVLGHIELDAENPRTEIALMPSPSTLDREMYKTLTCIQCKQDYRKPVSARVSPSGRAPYMSKRFCSNACAQAHGRRPANCHVCGAEFQRRSSGNSVCSEECAAISRERGQAQAVIDGKRLGPPLCEKCGARVSRREYKQCAKCLGRGRPNYPTNLEQDPKP